MKSTTEPMIQRKYHRLGEIFNERQRRLWAAVEASPLGRGGIWTVARATGLSRTTIYQGLEELGHDQAEAGLRRQRVRSQGGGSDLNRWGRWPGVIRRPFCRRARRDGRPWIVQPGLDVAGQLSTRRSNSAVIPFSPSRLAYPCTPSRSKSP